VRGLATTEILSTGSNLKSSLNVGFSVPADGTYEAHPTEWSQKLWKSPEHLGLRISDDRALWAQTIKLQLNMF
jgi:hypothetical protein